MVQEFGENVVGSSAFLNVADTPRLPLIGVGGSASRSPGKALSVWIGRNFR
jgi:hypothetical protein